MDAVDDAEYHCRFQGQTDEGVGDAAMVEESGDGSAYAPGDVAVGSLSGEGHGEGGVGGFPVEAGASEGGSKQTMCDGIHCG
jgi:hypothetical protein